MFGCMRRIILLVVLLLLLALAWIFRDRLRDQWRQFRGNDEVAAAAGPELADAANAKLESLRDGTTDRVALGSAELESLLHYKYAGVLPAFARDPAVELDQDRIRLRVRVPADQLPDVKGLGDLGSFLPDTTELQLTGTLLPLNGGRIALAVSEVQAARFPMPDRMIHDALKRIGRRDEPGLPKDAIGVALPSGITAAYIRNDSLVLISRTSD